MVRCPRGSPSQVKANLAYFNRPCTLSSNNDFAKGQMEKESEMLATESEGSDLDSVRADKRWPPTARDELVYFFISSFLDILLVSWDGKPCMKPKLGTRRTSAENDSEEFGEDLGPCEFSIVSSTVDSLNDLYQKRSSNLSKDKFKKDSETTESEYLNEEDFESPSPERGKTANDEDVHFVLANGAWYKGRISRKLMEGEGYYFWEDGTTFQVLQGEFEGGCVTGKGRLEFPDLSTYEGGVYKGFRHGEGIFCFSHSPVMYSGQWWLGRKHGHGLIVYDDPKESHSYYRGQWQDGVKEGFGFRQYLSGAKYVGFWSNGKRHGKGVMLWKNRDIYRGEWKEGLMHGYGEYTWNGFVNKSLSYPAINVYRGYWEDGKRNGRGLLELKTGCLIETIWLENMKNGPGAVVCCNGAVVASERLFRQDKPVASEKNAEDLKKDECSLTEKSQSESVSENLVTTSIPINSPVYQLNLYPHTLKLFSQINRINLNNLARKQMESQMVSITPKTSYEVVEPPPEAGDENFVQLEDHELEIQRQKEENLLRNYIVLKIPQLRDRYEYYSTLPCEEKPSFRCILLRLFLWQMLIDCRITGSSLSLIDIDDILAHEDYLLMQNVHDPFERIQFWQFIQILIFLSWNLYGQYVLGEPSLVEDENVRDFLQYFGGCECRNVLKMAFKYFLEKHLFVEEPGSAARRNRFEESDLAPMEAMYVIYCNVGEAHSVRDLVNAICSKGSEDAAVPTSVRYFEKLPFYKVAGRNAFTIAGEIQHVPLGENFNTPEIFPLESQEMKLEPKSELTCFNGLKAMRVIRCLVEVCPGIVVDDCIVNMDYKLTFLEFYKVIIQCAKLQLRMKAMKDIRSQILEEYKTQLEEYNKQLTEFEKQKESQVLSRKKSRQLTDAPKKGKK